jgi:hypothetical protein
MSMDRCKFCCNPIDTDWDLECYGPEMDGAVCQSCREYRGIDRDREYAEWVKENPPATFKVG